MFQFLFALTIKSSILLIAGCTCLLILSRATAASRHFLCSRLFAGLLLLPVLMRIMPSWGLAAIGPIWFLNGGFAAQPGDSVSHTQPVPLWAVVVAGIWLVGAALSLMRLLIGWLLLKAKARRGEVTRDAILCDVNSPVTFGVFQPVILLPRNAAGWSGVQKRAVLLHERAHIERRDCLWNYLAQIALAMLWFHPLAWWLHGTLRREEEIACDDAALSFDVQPAAYAEVLLGMTCNLPSSFLFASPMSGCGAAQLRARLAHIVEYSRDRKGSLRPNRALLIFLAIVLLGCASNNPPGTKAIYKIGGDVSMPKLLYKVEPTYSAAARKDKVQGTVVLSIVVGIDGRAHDIRVVRSFRPDLDANAVSAVTQWKFGPAVRQGIPVAVQSNVEINYRLL